MYNNSSKTKDKEVVEYVVHAKIVTKTLYYESKFPKTISLYSDMTYVLPDSLTNIVDMDKPD